MCRIAAAALLTLLLMAGQHAYATETATVIYLSCDGIIDRQGP